jgi:hypothetical protein
LVKTTNKQTKTNDL